MKTKADADRRWLRRVGLYEARRRYLPNAARYRALSEALARCFSVEWA